MFAATAFQEFFVPLVLWCCLLGVPLFKAYLMLARPDVYKAQLEHDRLKREQRNRFLGPVVGGGLRIASRFFGR